MSGTQPTPRPGRPAPPTQPVPGQRPAGQQPPGQQPPPRPQPPQQQPQRPQQPEPQRDATRTPGKAPGDAPRDEKADAERKDAQAAGSIGAQIILDYNSDAGLGARGGAGGTIEENQIARDKHLVALGLDPVNCSGPPPSPEVLKARREAEKAKLDAAARGTPSQGPKATRMSSLAAGIAPDLPDTEPPPDGGNGEAPAPTAPPVNRDVPHATQQGAQLNCTMGNWDGEPTSYGYQWQIDGADVGTGSATYDVQAGDVGKNAVCVVTATNALGSTAAPPSNGVVVA